MDFDRASGLLLHITSLPSPFGIGDLGPDALRFADALAHAGQRWWQVLPIGPVGYGYSPYSGTSSFAGASLLISPQDLVAEGLLEPGDVAGGRTLPMGAVAYSRVTPWKSSLLSQAFARFRARPRPADFDRFCEAQSYWLDHYAAFSALRLHYGKPWTHWSATHRSNPGQALRFARMQLADHWEAARFKQYIFEKQWQRLRAYCHKRGIRIIGDMPIYVSHDSADVWAAQDQYHLDSTGNPTLVGGVPPDFFSAAGQRWGNPLYRWSVMERRGFDWWQKRFRRALALFDVIRLDHFRGFAGSWEIPASEETAVHGRWVRGPGASLFEHLARTNESLPIVAEDLGVITDDVRELMRQFGFPGMAVLQFAFDSGDTNPYLPHNYKPKVVAYTGTHDNDTLIGWLAGASAPERAFAERYLRLTRGNEHWQSVGALMASSACLVITPVQDVLGLGSAARMNTPGTVGDNWQWRMGPRDLDALLGEAGARLRKLCRRHGRCATVKLSHASA